MKKRKTVADLERANARLRRRLATNEANRAALQCELHECEALLDDANKELSILRAKRAVRRRATAENGAAWPKGWRELR
jgi:septal ring factor EnvC (AmiA/AmiB activator)